MRFKWYNMYAVHHTLGMSDLLALWTISEHLKACVPFRIQMLKQSPASKRQGVGKPGDMKVGS